MEAPDECGHHGDFAHKVYSIEQIDGVIKTLIQRFESAGEKFAMLVCPDHPTPCAIKTHSSDPIPYLLYSNTESFNTNSNAKNVRYTEEFAEKSGNYLTEGNRLIEKLFKIK